MYNYFRTSSRKTFVDLEHMHSACPDDKFWGTYVFKKLLSLETVRDFKLKKYRNSGKKFLAVLSKLHSTLPEEHCERENFSEKIKISLVFWALSEKISAFQQKFFGRIVETALYVSKGTISTDYFLKIVLVY